MYGYWLILAESFFYNFDGVVLLCILYSFIHQFFLVEGNNNIRFKIQSALKVSDEAKKAYPYDVPAPGSYIVGGSRNFIRKAQSGTLAHQQEQHFHLQTTHT